MPSKKYLGFSLVFTGLMLFNIKVTAQKGHHIMLWGGPQIVTLANFDDSRGTNTFDPNLSKLDRQTTIRFGGGLDYIYNFANSYGVQSGIYYSQHGQKYAGFIDGDLNIPGDSQTVRFESHVYMDYYRIPLMFRFSSLLEESDRINLSIFAGLQMGFLRGVESVYTTPAAPDTITNRYPNFNFDDLYEKTDLGVSAGAQFNILINKNISTLIGVRFDRSLFNIENFSANIPKDAPAEWQFPVSVKKTAQTQFDPKTRRETKHTSVNLYTGI